MRRALLVFLLLSACKDEPPVPPDCQGPDFDVLITAPPDAMLPADTLVRVDYPGGDSEEHGIDDGVEHEIIFCTPSDREGNPLGSGSGGEGGAGTSRATGAGGHGGEGAVSDYDALRCRLWTDGPAVVTVTSSLYPTVETNLRGKNGTCTVMAEIPLGPNDGGT